MNLTNKFTIIASTLMIAILLVACGGDSEEPTNTGDPSNLSFEINIVNATTGAVTVIANATDAVLYEFDMGTPNADTGSSNDGVFDFVYENTGSYIVEVKAYGNSGRFVTAQKQVSITSGDPSTAGEGYITPISYDGWDLIFNDEFDGINLNQSAWCFQNGNGCPDLCGWGNNELEYYRPDNTSIKNGTLIIEARKENFQSNEYTSSKLLTQDKIAFTYGRVDVRAMLPRGKGLWPAIWMLGTNINSVSWPECGEIDIMEMIGGSGGESKTYGTAHWRNDDNEHVSSGDDRVSPDGLDNKFHVFSIIWDETKIQWLLDDVPYHTLSITSSELDAFHKPFYMILNVAVGGNWPGNPNSSTEFPTQMQVDYVRVFQEQ